MDALASPTDNREVCGPHPLKNGRQALVRPVVPRDAELLASFVRHLSFGTRYFRYGRGDFQASEAKITQLCNVHSPIPHHWVALADHAEKEVLIGSGRFVVDPGHDECEMALVVADAWQGLGVGSLLLRALVQSARQCRLPVMHIRVLPTNEAMLRFAFRNGFARRTADRGASLNILTLHLDRDRAQSGPGTARHAQQR